MINEPLLDFIRQQTSKGITKDVISKELLDNGWTLRDVEEGFRAVTINAPAPFVMTNTSGEFIPPSYKSMNVSISSTQKKDHPIRNTFLFILILFLLAGGASVYYFKDKLINLPIIANLLSKK